MACRESDVLNITVGGKTYTREKIKQLTEKALKDKNLTSGKKLGIIRCNQDDKLNILMKIQQHTYQHVFLAFPDAFYTRKHHYDWWMFPMHVPREWRWQERNYHCSINKEEAKELVANTAFFQTYIDSINLYLKALITHGWNDYPVRYARMLHSLSLFLDLSLEDEAKTNALVSVAVMALEYSQTHLKTRYPEYALFNSGMNMLQEALNAKLDVTCSSSDSIAMHART